MEKWLAWAEAAELREVAGATNYWVLAISAVAGIMVWVVTTPLRNVSWAFLDNAVDNGRAVYFFTYTCGDRYLEAARNANALSLPPLEYACALISLAFLIPIAVLQDYEARFGITGRFCLRWCEAFHHSCCLFIPDAVQLLWVSTCKYARATGEATVAVIERTGDFLMGIYLAASLLLSLLVYLPRLVYESVEGVLGGPLGVVLVMLMVDVYLEFARGSCYWSVLVLVVGCYSHGLRYYWMCRPCRRTGLGSKAKQGWNGLTGRIGRREERERASLERLRGTHKKGTSTETQDGGTTPEGTPTGGVPEVVAGGTVRQAVEGTTRRGRRGSVGENCHGLQLEGGLAILADCIQKVCSIQGPRATSDKTEQEKQTSAFHV
ncbi:hypothetical protein F444_03150 [Phytophthora nicotianae P1976]|uniref:Uncharacterized protein n=1 Tax=Phytophthora nicotianae P1976 TaxID=1317066 RepID=A0A081AV37_PHYNI|nr:hypothetical protein F444_03150 [Phytophthora nicotianae P1976]